MRPSSKPPSIPPPHPKSTHTITQTTCRPSVRPLDPFNRGNLAPPSSPFLPPNHSKRAEIPTSQPKLLPFHFPNTSRPPVPSPLTARCPHNPPLPPPPNPPCQTHTLPPLNPLKSTKNSSPANDIGAMRAEDMIDKQTEPAPSDPSTSTPLYTPQPPLHTPQKKYQKHLPSPNDTVAMRGEDERRGGDEQIDRASSLPPLDPTLNPLPCPPSPSKV